MPETDEILNPHKYQCIRCKAPADVIFKKMLPYCFQHEPAESKAARQPEEVEMDKSAKVISATTDVPVPATPTPATPPTVSIGGGWVVNAKDGTELHNGFASKKEASKWASLEVEHKRMKAGQYKIIKK